MKDLKTLNLTFETLNQDSLILAGCNFLILKLKKIYIFSKQKINYLYLLK